MSAGGVASGSAYANTLPAKHHPPTTDLKGLRCRRMVVHGEDLTPLELYQAEDGAEAMRAASWVGARVREVCLR